MTQVLITRSKLDSLASAISAKSGEPLPLTIAQMEDAVDGIDTGGGGNDFVVTLSYDDQTELWEPDKTLAEIDAAYVGGKEIVTQALDVDGYSVPVMYFYDSLYGMFAYTVYSYGYDSGGGKLVEASYYLDSTGVHDDLSVDYRDTSAADAQPSDVAQGMVFFNADGYQEGTASGGNDFVVTLYDDGQGAFLPDCTWSELMAAYGADKNIVFTAGDTMGCSWGFVSQVKVEYTVFISANTGDYDKVYSVNHEWTSSGAAMVGYDEYPDTSVATAVAADVASGKTFFNGSGYQTGTAVTPTARTASDVTVSGDTVTIPAGAYSSQVTKSVASGTAGTPTATKGAVSNHAVSVTPSVTNSTGYISGGTKTGTAVSVSASELVSGTYTVSASGSHDVTNYASASVAAGSASAPSTISGTSATVSTGTNTLTLSKTVSVTPSVTAGYVSSGTAGNSSVSLTASVTTQAAQTIYPSATDQSIAASRYLTGAQTIKGVAVANLTAANIKSGVTVTVGDSADADRIMSVTGTYSGGGSSKNVQVAQSTTRVASTSYTKTASLTCSVSGKYDVYWDCFRSSTSGTNGSQLYIGGSAHGDANTTWASSSVNTQTNHLTNVQINANQEVAVYVRSRGTSYYASCGQLTIVQSS